MESQNAQIQSELDSFRERWRAEVSARNRTNGAQDEGPSRRQEPAQSQSQADAGSSSEATKPPRKAEPLHKRSASKSTAHLEEEDDYIPGFSFETPAPTTGHRLDSPPKGENSATASSTATAAESHTALDLYEKAVDRETHGKLGDSLDLYRKAFRMDSRVDRAYREKHFAGRWIPAQPGASNVQQTSTAEPAANPQPQQDSPVLSLPDLIASFSGLVIEGAPPAIEGTAAPPCPISELPDEILVHILRDVAILDVGDFVRLMQVCKRLAYLVATEDRIWRRVCLGSEFGFGAMIHHWQRTIAWQSLDPEEELIDSEGVFSMEQLQERRDRDSEDNTLALHKSLYNSSWQKMFRRRARIRFNGCYISTVNYIRAGQASAHQITWNSPVHIVTYYRYLRFFRDGTVISLTTTVEPLEVVHHLTKDMVVQHANHGAPHLPTAFMRSAFKGRWRMSSLSENPDATSSTDAAEAEGDVVVETEGVGKYMYRMELTLKSAGKVSRNNKLTWKGFWSYDRLTDDWGTFTLKNDKAFHFSRVKSYGFAGV